MPGALFRLQERDWTFADIFRGAGIRTLSGLDLLEVGCGGGASLRRFVGLGAEPDRLAGIDLVTERIEAARRLRLPACCSHYAAIIRPLPVRPVPATRASS